MTADLLLLAFCQLITITLTQDTICVWNSIDDWDHLNGEYNLQSSTAYNGHPYWKQAPTPSPTNTCPATPFYIFAADSSGYLYWQISSGPSTQYTYGSPNCEDKYYDYLFPIDPTQCISGYYVWATNFIGSRYKIPLTITTGSCPTLPCDEITITNTGATQCDHTFVADPTRNNLFVHSNTYFFFNQYIFKWACADDISQYEDCSGNIPTAEATKIDGWTDVSVGSTITLIWENNNDITLKCIRQTPQPTDPEILTSLPPKQTSFPTLNPSILPSVESSINPTNLATRFPNIYSTESPTSNPTLHSTDIITTFGESTVMLKETHHTIQRFDDIKQGSFVNARFIVLLSIGAVVLCLCVFCIGYANNRKESKMVINKVSMSSVVNKEIKPQNKVVYVDDEDNDEDNEDNDDEIQQSDAVAQEEEQQQTDMIEYWLESVVGFPQYLPLFLSNGYESIKFIKYITNASELFHIGIESLEHQQHIMDHIGLLNQKDIVMGDLGEKLVNAEFVIGSDSLREVNLDNDDGENIQYGSVQNAESFIPQDMNLIQVGSNASECEQIADIHRVVSHSTQIGDEEVMNQINDDEFIIESDSKSHSNPDLNIGSNTTGNEQIGNEEVMINMSKDKGSINDVL